MNLLPKDSNGCPFLILAPMEGVGDRTFRKAMSVVGGYDEGVTEFISVPCNAHVASLAKVYLAGETAPIPLAAQLMGADPELMALMSQEIAKRGAKRIDLNCGCPSKTVTGRGAGSSLLKEPSHLFQVARAMVQAVDVPVTLKMRSGFADTSLFKENLLAAQESGVRYITLHPRTKVDGYGPPAKWEMIALAKSILTIPVVGNGDILNVDDALRMLKMTHCDALMVGRGAVINPFIFHQIRAYFAGVSFERKWEDIKKYLETYLSQIPLEMPVKVKINKLKQMMSFIFRGSAKLLEKRSEVLTAKNSDPDSFLHYTLPLLQECWQ